MKKRASFWLDHLFIIIVTLCGLLRYRKFFMASYPCLQLLRDDLVNLYYPIYFFAKKVFYSGAFPFWDPHTFLGHPIATNLGFGLFYPPLLGLLALPILKELTPRCFELFIICHFILAGTTIYISSRILKINNWGALSCSIAYLSFPVNNYMVNWAPVVFGIPWIPLIIATFLRILNIEKGYFNRRIFLLYIFSTIMLYTTLHPSLIAYTFITLFLLWILHITQDILQRRKDLPQIGKKYFNLLIVLIMPFLILSFIIIPIFVYFPFIARTIIPLNLMVGSLSFIEFWHILLPNATTSLGPLCYFGIIFLGIVFFYSLLIDKKIKNPLLWTAPIMVAFWLLYSLEKSPIFFFIKKYVPLMSTLRYATRSLVILAVFFSFMLGDFFSLLTRQWKERLRFLKLNIGLDLLLPLAIISLLVFGYKDLRIFGGTQQAFIKNFSLSLFLLGMTFFLIRLILRYPFKYNWRKLTLAMAIFLLIVGWIEVVHFAPISFIVEEKSRYAPYDGFIKKALNLFPEVYKDKSLYRYHDFGFMSIVPYWTDTYTSSSIILPYVLGVHSATPKGYYYLWSRGWPGDKNTFYINSNLPLDSPIYDLMGVRYFLFPEKRIWIYLSGHNDYYRLCKDEWVSGAFKKKRRISHFRIYLTSEFKDEVLGDGLLYLDNGFTYQFNLSGHTGWQKIEIPLTESENFKITIKRNKMFTDRNGPRDILLGCAIVEIGFYDDKGEKILINKDSIIASSTDNFSTPVNLIDDNIATVWRPSLEGEISRFVESKTIRRLKEGLYLNTDVLPRAFMVYDYYVTRTKDELWERLHSSDFKPEAVVLLDKDPRIILKNNGFYPNKVSIENYKPNNVDVYVDTPEPGFLVLSDVYVPGWEVWVDGKKENALLAYGIFRAVWVDKGKHLIRFKYLPPFFRIGLTLSIASFVSILVFSKKRLIQ